MPPSVVDAMARYRNVLDSMDAGQASRLMQSWLALTRDLSAEMEALAVEMAQRVAEGKPAKLWHLQRMSRYQSLMRQIGQQVDQYTPGVITEIEQMQTTYAGMALEHSQTLIDMQTPSVYTQFDRLPVGAVEHMVGNAGDGSPLANLFRGMPRETGQAVTNSLLKGTGLGWHPTKTARAMRDASGLTYQRSILIARTEQNRVYRETSRQQYMVSNLVEGYRRSASKGPRTCIACLMMDGKEFPLTVPFEDHPNGRCAPIPIVIDAPVFDWETGEQWFRRQDAATQIEIMGPKKYTAWQAGQFDLEDLVTKREDPVWGASYVPTPLSALVN